jgi:SagB-type dehydrogenase family enzyme
VSYWRDASIIFHNYATGDVLKATPLVSALLHSCTDWRDIPSLARELEASPVVTSTLVAQLVARHLLHRADQPVDPRERAMRAFRHWNPAAGFFHTATKNVPFTPSRLAEAALLRQAQTWPMPRVTKRFRDSTTVRLPLVQGDGEFAQVLLKRRTWRRFSKRPVGVDDLATTIGLAVGIQQWVPTEIGRIPLKTSPSGGARHPIECYVCVRNVTGVRPGLYHYAADAHRLERLRGGNMSAKLRAWMPRSEYFAKAAFAIVLTAVFERQLWRYPYARAYRAALAEAGHVCQTFCLTATWLGLAPFCLMGLADDEIERDLGIDGITESVLYVAGAGSKPRGVEWAPTTRGTLDVRPNPVFRKR